MAEEKRKEKEGQAMAIVWDCGSPLYDSYEIASLGHLIERNMLALPSASGLLEEDDAAVQSRIEPRDQEKSLVEMMSNEGACYEEGLFAKLVRRYLMKRRVMKGKNDEKGAKVSGRFYSFCRRIGFCKRKDADVKRLM